MRFTEKKEGYIEELKTNGHIYFVDDILPNNCKLTGRSIEKLGHLEDDEDDLGLDLGIFAKTLKYGGYIKTAFGIEKFKIRNGDIDFKGKLFYVTTEYTLRTLVFKDYGITWALTKEELL